MPALPLSLYAFPPFVFSPSRPLFTEQLKIQQLLCWDGKQQTARAASVDPVSRTCARSRSSYSSLSLSPFLSPGLFLCLFRSRKPASEITVRTASRLNKALAQSRSPERTAPRRPKSMHRTVADAGFQCTGQLPTQIINAVEPE